MGVLDIGHGVGMRGGAHTGLIGEQAALDALADGLLQREADAAADDGVGHECILEDHADGLRDVLDAGDQHDQAADEVQTCHDGHQLLGNGADALYAADQDQHGNEGNNQAGDPVRDAEGGVAGLADRVGLHHCAHEAQREDGCNDEEQGEEIAELALESGLDVVNRAAGYAAVLVYHTGLLGQHGLSIDGSHAEEGDDPHPEDGARAADQDRAACADDVAGAYLRCDGRCQRLEGAQAALLLFAEQGEVAEHAAHAFAEAADLHELCADREIQAASHQQDDEDVIGEVEVDGLHEFEQCVHGLIIPFLGKNKSHYRADNDFAYGDDLPQPPKTGRNAENQTLSFCLRDSRLCACPFGPRHAGRLQSHIHLQSSSFRTPESVIPSVTP